MAIDKDKIREKARKVQSEGLDKEVLKEANNLYKNSIRKAEQTFGKSVGKAGEAKLTTHVKPEDLAYFMEVFGDQSFSNMKALDIGCGMPFPASKSVNGYAPVLSIALNDLGVKTYAVDMYGDSEAMENLGINFKEKNVAPQFLKYLGNEFLEENDFVSARSLLGGGFYNREGYQFGSNSLFPQGPDEEERREWDFYSNMVDELKDKNGQTAVYELDTPRKIVDEYDGGLASNSLQKKLGGEIIKSGEIYQPSWMILDPSKSYGETELKGGRQ